MVEISRHPVNLDNLMNEGIAFAFDRFKGKNTRLSHCTVTGHDQEKKACV